MFSISVYMSLLSRCLLTQSRVEHTAVDAALMAKQDQAFVKLFEYHRCKPLSDAKVLRKCCDRQSQSAGMTMMTACRPRWLFQMATACFKARLQTAMEEYGAPAASAQKTMAPACFDDARRCLTCAWTERHPGKA